MRHSKHLALFVLLAAGMRAEQDAQAEPDGNALARMCAQLAIEGRLADATEALQAALAIRERTRPIDSRALAYALNDLGVAYKLQNRLGDAARLYDRSLQILREQARSGERIPLLAVALHNLGKVREAQGRRKSAERFLREAIRQWEECCGPDHPDLAASLESLAS